MQNATRPFCPKTKLIICAETASKPTGIVIPSTEVVHLTERHTTTVVAIRTTDHTVEDATTATAIIPAVTDRPLTGIVTILMVVETLLIVVEIPPTADDEVLPIIEHPSGRKISWQSPPLPNQALTHQN